MPGEVREQRFAIRGIRRLDLGRPEAAPLAEPAHQAVKPRGERFAITLDRCGHLMPGSEEKAVGPVDAYLARADTAARLAALEG